MDETEKAIRDELLKVPDHVVLKSLIEYLKKLEQSSDNKDKIIDKWYDLYIGTKEVNEMLIEVFKEYMSHDAYITIKKEVRKRLKTMRKNEITNK